MDRGLLDKQSAFSKVSAPLNKEDSHFPRIKVGVLVFFGILSSLALGYFLRDFLVWGNSSLLYSSIAAAAFLIILNLQPFFIENREALTFVALFESLAMVGNFADKISWTYLISFVFIFLILLSGLLNGLRELEEGLKIRFWPVARMVLPKGLIAISLFASIFSVLHLQTDSQKFFISRETFQKIFSINAPLIQKIYPGIDPVMTMDAVVKTIAQNQLNRLPEFQSLSKKAQNQELEKQSGALIANFSQYIGAPLNPRLGLGDAIFEALAIKYENLSDNMKTLLFVGLGVLIFLTIETLAWPIRLVIAALAFLVYEILITAGFAKITVETRSKEVLTLE